MHKNVPNTVSQITNAFGEEGVNIENLTNKSRGDFAYTLLDIDQEAPEAAIAKLNSIDDIRRVRVVC